MIKISAMFGGLHNFVQKSILIYFIIIIYKYINYIDFYNDNYNHSLLLLAVLVVL